MDMQWQHWPRLHERIGNSQHLPNAGMVILATLASVEFFDHVKIPTQLNHQFVELRVAADGLCFWSCLWLSVVANSCETVAWHIRPRNASGFAAGDHCETERKVVFEWAHSFSATMSSSCRKRLEGHISVEDEDIAT